jgi:histone-lysine N-methyltransferase SETMAR
MKTVHSEFLEQGRTVNRQCCLEILARLREAVRWRRPEFWSDAWILHHDNALAHDTLAVREFLAKKSIMKLYHPPYSPDLAPYDFWLFPKLKTALKGHRFSDTADIQGHATTILQSSSRNVLSSANTDSLIVLVRKETTSKVTPTISA